MAEETVTEDVKVALMLEAAWELDKIARCLPDLVPLDADQVHYIVKALAGRMLRLTGLLMEAISDDAPDFKKMKRIVDFSELGQA